MPFPNLWLQRDWLYSVSSPAGTGSLYASLAYCGNNLFRGAYNLHSRITYAEDIMTILYRFSGLLVALLLSAGAYAADVQVEGAWSRATAPGQDAGMVDMSITSKQDGTLVGLSSPACKSVELHSMTHEDGMMKMREVKELALPAGKRISLGESGYHLMLIGLKAPLEAGGNVPLTLTVRMANKRMAKVEVNAEVRPLAASTMQDGGHMHHGHH